MRDRSADPVPTPTMACWDTIMYMNASEGTKGALSSFVATIGLAAHMRTPSTMRPVVRLPIEDSLVAPASETIATCTPDTPAASTVGPGASASEAGSIHETWPTSTSCESSLTPSKKGSRHAILTGMSSVSARLWKKATLANRQVETMGGDSDWSPGAPLSSAPRLQQGVFPTRQGGMTEDAELNVLQLTIPRMTSLRGAFASSGNDGMPSQLPPKLQSSLPSSAPQLCGLSSGSSPVQSRRDKAAMPPECDCLQTLPAPLASKQFFMPSETGLTSQWKREIVERYLLSWGPNIRLARSVSSLPPGWKTRRLPHPREWTAWQEGHTVFDLPGFVIAALQAVCSSLLSVTPQRFVGPLPLPKEQVPQELQDIYSAFLPLKSAFDLTIGAVYRWDSIAVSALAFVIWLLTFTHTVWVSILVLAWVFTSQPAVNHPSQPAARQWVCKVTQLEERLGNVVFWRSPQASRRALLLLLLCFHRSARVFLGGLYFSAPLCEQFGWRCNIMSLLQLVAAPDNTQIAMELLRQNEPLGDWEGPGLRSQWDPRSVPLDQVDEIIKVNQGIDITLHSDRVIKVRLTQETRESAFNHLLAVAPFVWQVE